ncbi:MAG: LysM peptidoglycan-binding domain-containing protein, partial [Burkholderiales bacterium]|nr:LysM peptidoglycan-binding domain-containing protein [Burkholderiales bacterium]
MFKRLLLLLPLLALGGCATLDDFLANIKKGKGPATVAFEDRAVEDPIAPNTFVLTSADQSVVGEPQVVFTRKEDTLSDLAREYGLGYDEILAANPGIDPWLPGENTPIMLPTQYVLPNAPKSGVVLNIATKRLFYYPEA